MQYSPELIDALKKDRGQDDVAVTITLGAYTNLYPTIPGAPTPGALTAADSVAVALIGQFNADVHKDWKGYLAYVGAEIQADLDRVNPYLPNWFSKTDDRPNIWVSDTTNLPDDSKTALANVLRASMPPMTDKVRNLLAEFPTDNMDYLDDVAKAMWTLSSLFAWDLGEGPDPVFRWGPSLCLLGGLGTGFVRAFATCMSYDEDWQHWAHADDRDIADDILQAHKTTGYPVGLLRCDFRRLNSVMGDLSLMTPAGVTVTPRWFKAAMALHILKYVRLYDGQSPHVFVAYDGAYTVVPIGSPSEPLASKVNAELAKSVCKILRLPVPTGNNRTWVMGVVEELFRKITPQMLPAARRPTYYPEILVAPAVQVRDMHTRRSAYHFCNPGVSVHGMARLVPSSGEIDKDAFSTGEELFLIRWPIGVVREAELVDWRASLPDTVEPKRFSHTINTWIRNWNKLGHPEGADAIVDALVTVDLYSEALVGSSLGVSKRNEFPLVFALPMEGTTDGSTNQGKTTIAAVIGEALAPGLWKKALVRFSPSTSAPAMRSLANPLYEFGTAIYDEFLLVEARDHVLNQQGLQTLATGGLISPGRAGENDPGVRLSHPLFFSAKLVKQVKDILNRMAPLFLDVLNDRTRCSDAELEQLQSGWVSVQARWNHLFWCAKNNILGKLQQAKPRANSTWRFGAHLACAELFTTNAEILAYFQAAARQTEEQYEQAEESGLAENMGVNFGFDPMYFLQNVHKMTMDGIFMEGSGKKHDVMDFLVAVVEDGGRRRFSSTLNGAKEASAKQRFAEFLRRHNNSYNCGGYTLTYVPSAKSDYMVNRTKRAYITLTKDADDAGTATA